MEKIDKNYLWLQFWNKVYQKNATEFQGFFEDIMQNAFTNFQKIRPYGNQGDGGNDGYIPDEGKYFQSYAPCKPSEKEAEAARKLKKNFERLKKEWSEIAKIKIFYFVFNDKGLGISIEIERALSELRNNNQDIDFKKFTPRDLELIFFGLKNEQILELGFDIDSRNTLCITREYLDKLEIDLDRDSVKFVLKALENLKNIILSISDENLLLDYEILECRALQKIEKMKEAKEKYESLCKRYPNDPRAFLYLAEFYLNNEEYEKNANLLNQSEKIDNSHWLLALEKLIRDYRLGNQIDVEKIGEKTFPTDPKIKSKFYLVYSFFLARAGDHTKAVSFIERAIYFNPENIKNYDAKLSILEDKIFSQNNDKNKFIKDIEDFLKEIEIIEQKFTKSEEMTPRNQSILNFRKLDVFRNQNNFSRIEKLSKESFELILKCYFDQLVDELLVALLISFDLPDKDFERLLHYLKTSEKLISDNLAREIVLKFLIGNNLLTKGKIFFESINKKNILDFINLLEKEKYDEILTFIKEDLQFTIAVAAFAKGFPVLRRKIIENLPNDGAIQKEKLMLLLNYEEGNINEAFELLRGLDFSNLDYFECDLILKIAQKKMAWDFIIIVLEKLLEYERETHSAVNLKLQLFTANLKLERFLDAIQIGEQILSNSDEMTLLDDRSKESILGQIILVRLKRDECLEAKALLEKYLNIIKTYEFKVEIESMVYLNNKDAYKALASIIDGVKMLSKPTPEQYGNLFIIFTQISNLIDFNLDSLEKVENDCFVKFKGQDRWYFVGDDIELDATKISSKNNKYSKFFDKKIGEKVVFDNKYYSDIIENTIEKILPIEKYICWQSNYLAIKLTKERRWEAMDIIEIPSTGDTIDTKYLIARMEDDTNKIGEFFDLYCQENIPLAFLAITEGGLVNAIGRIVNENKGFIKFSTGTLLEINQQKEVAKRIILGEPFYLDGTSALVLSKIGLLEKINEHLPNLKVPQSVITLLLETEEKFRYSPGHVGYLGYDQKRIIYSPFDQDKREIVRNNFKKSRRLLESKPQSIVFLSAANKSDYFSEQKIPSELCDACILAQKEKIPILTEDYLYLQVNEFETKKKAPEYFSAFALVSILLEQKKTTFDEFLDFFSYLSSYRFRFLPVYPKDIDNAVFGEGNIKLFSPERIRQLNFPLVLSKQYGVPSTRAFILILNFIIKIIVDDTILPAMTERIFVEIISTFPTDKDKKSLGKMLLLESIKEIDKKQQIIIIESRLKEKVDLLFQVVEIYTPISNIKVF